MKQWQCRLDAESVARFRRELDVPEIKNQVTCQASADAPAMHVREQARDAFVVLALQENPALDRTRVRGLLEELVIICESEDEIARADSEEGR